MTRFRLLSFLLSSWQHRLTPAGKALLAAIFCAGFAGSSSLAIPLYHLFLPLVSLYVCAFLCGFALKPRVQLRGALPSRTTAGEVLTTELELQSRSRLPAYGVGLAFFGLPRSLRLLNLDETCARLPGRGTARLPVRLRAQRRGLYPLPKLTAYSTFPFRLFRNRGSQRPGGALLVLPDFHPLAEVHLPGTRLYQPGGISLTSNIGESPEYIGNRDFHPGDPARRIDFRAWARLARPVVREYQEEYYCRLALVLDTYVPPGRKRPLRGFPELEAAISLSASIADVLARGDYIIDVFAAGPQLYVFRGGRSIGHLDNILEILACLEECRSNPFETIGPALVDQLPSITAIVFVLLDWDEHRERFVRTVTESGASPRVVIVREPRTTLPPEPAQDWAGEITQLRPQDITDGGMTEL